MHVPNAFAQLIQHTGRLQRRVAQSMPTIIPPFKLSNHQPDGSHALGSNLKQWWHALPIGLGSLIWSGLVTTLIILGMLLAFHQVVIDAVQQSELRHQAIALEAEASWRCNTLRGPSAVGSCLAQLKLAAPASAAINQCSVAHRQVQRGSLQTQPSSVIPQLINLHWRK